MDIDSEFDHIKQSELEDVIPMSISLEDFMNEFPEGIVDIMEDDNDNVG